MSLPDKVEFKDTSCVLLTSAKLKFRRISQDKLIKALEKHFCLPRWDIDSCYEAEFKKYKNIVFNKEFKIDSELKVKLGSFDFIVTYNKSEKRYSVDVYAFIYPVIDVVNLFFSISLDDMTVDELIKLRKVVQFDKIKEGGLKLCNSGFMKKTCEFKYTDFSSLTKEIYRIFIKLSRQRKYKLFNFLSCLSWKKYKCFRKEYFEKYQEETTKDNGGSKKVKKLIISKSRRKFMKYDYYNTQLFEKINIEKLLLLEIRELSDPDINCVNDEKFVERYSKKIYGLLVCDEGYEFVPESTVKDAINESFGSRDFFRVYASNVGVLMFNFIDCQCRKQYNQFQLELACCFEDNKSEILAQCPGIAGMEHGILLAMEESINLLTIINSNMKKSYLSKNNKFKKISKIISNRKKLIDIINLISSININEISNLKNLMLKKIGILAFVSRVRERLDIAENDTLVIYQRRNNFLVMLITILGVFFAAMSISEIKEIIMDFIKNL